MTDVELLLKEAAELRDDPLKCVKTRRVARKIIEVSHGVIDLKDENARLIKQIEELRIKLREQKEVPESA